MFFRISKGNPRRNHFYHIIDGKVHKTTLLHLKNHHDEIKKAEDVPLKTIPELKELEAAGKPEKVAKVKHTKAYPHHEGHIEHEGFKEAVKTIIKHEREAKRSQKK